MCSEKLQERGGIGMRVGSGRTQGAILPVPYPDGLVIRRRQDPWQLMVEEYGPDIVQVAVQREQTSPSLVRPDLDLVVVTARDEEGLGVVEVDSSDRTVVLFEPINQGPHAVIPELDRRGVEGDENPWPRQQVRGRNEVERGNRITNRLGWKAMPFALDDLDSNYDSW